MLWYNTLRRILIPVVACCVAIVLFAGCGGDTGTARTYMRQADLAYTAAVAKGLELQKLQESLLPAVVSGDPAQLKAAAPQLPEIEAALVAYQESAKKALADYKKVDSLSGVADYKTYADMMVASLDELITSIDTGKALVSEFKDLVSKLNSSTPPDIAASKLHLFDKINLALNQSTKARQLAQKAKDYQSKQKLNG